MPNPTIPNHKNKPYGGAGPVQDPWLLDFIRSVSTDAVTWLGSDTIHNEFVEIYKEWIASTGCNRWSGLEDFKHGVVMQGTTEAFDKFYMKNRQRRFRCFRGEYMYHQLTWRNFWPNSWCYIDDEPLVATDAVVISLPFADTGNQHIDHNAVIAECNRRNIPVLLDCAYFGICADLDFDVSAPCIQQIAFSLSKTFPVAHARIGVRLTREDDDDPGFVHQKTAYVNRFACGLGIQLMQRVGPDYIYSKYAHRQQEFCQSLGVLPSQSVIFGIGDADWADYNRGTETNRLSFHQYLNQGELPE